ncbi:amino acid adenylation domain-containing protein [Streptomyces luteogriseus]|uniref:non-ribosomal peptide synthetase n=1 Tax=Streptomyces luteogriseus TaxID=68233 RepID=UPI0027861CE3|nr:amino acid adenylation domain-containing protein [Streptomyces luteogriseus]MDQ0714035.1 amino acid adenylation domain-containing protein [Streptomyces luteogriseus]
MAWPSPASERRTSPADASISPTGPIGSPTTAPQEETDDRWADQVRAACARHPLGLLDAGPSAPHDAGTVRSTTLPLEASLTDAVRDTARRHATTPHTVGLAALAVVLARRDGTAPAVIDTFTEDCAEAVPVLARIPAGATRSALLTEIRRSCEESVARLSGRRDLPARRVLFRHTAAGSTPAPVPPGTGHELTTGLREHDDAAELTAEYDDSRYAEADIRRFLTEVRTVLSALTGAEDRLLDDIPLVVGAEREELLALGRGALLTEAEPEPVYVSVRRLAAEIPGDVAVVSGTGRIDYAGLDAWAGAVSGRLQDLGVVPGDRVGVLAEPSVAMVAGVLGILRTGAAYVPVDPSHSDERVAAVFSDASVAAVVTTGGLQPRAATLGLRTVDAEDAEASTAHPARPQPVPAEACTAGPLPILAGPATPAPPPVARTAHDAAYLIYTSGTTGEPKGVVVEHGQLAASTLARRTVYPGRPVFLLVSPLAFDSSVAGLWGTLTAGGRLVVARPDEVRDPERLVALVEEHGVTHLLCVPSLHSVLLDAAERLGATRLRSLTSVTVAGEPLPESLPGRHFGVLGDEVSLVNEYGPTETTVWASYRFVSRAARPDIGGPVPGAALYVLDDRQRLLPRGVAGELVIGGAGVARGYFGRPDATERAFVPDTFTGTGARMYRTGDLVRWSAEGTLEFLGRRDHQVKIRGHRVELGAVETALGRVPEVRDAVVVPDGTRTSLVAFVLAPPGTEPERLRAALAGTLPPALLPPRFRILDSFPRTVNGKADRAALAATAAQPPAVTATTTAATATATTAQPPTAPVTPAPTAADLTARVSAAWAEVLGIAEVPSAVNFFDLGGHSLLMFRLQDALEAHTGVRPSPVDLFRHTTVTAQAGLVRDNGGTDGSVVPQPRGRDRRSLALEARRKRASRLEEAR